MGSGKSAGKSRLSGKTDRSAKRHKPAPQQKGSIRQFLQPLPKQQPRDPLSRDSSSEPDDLLPSQTPAVPLLAAAAPPPTGAPTAAGAKLQTSLLRSLQHRFATQQALDTPAAWDAAPPAPPVPAGGHPPVQHPQQQQQQQVYGAAAAAVEEEEDIEEDEEEDGGFQIFSQLAYEPTFLSQRPPEPPEPAAGTSQAATQTQVGQQQWGSQRPEASHRGGAGGLAGAAAAAAMGPAAVQQEEGEGQEEEADLGWPAGSQVQLTQPQSQQQQQQQQQEDALRRASGVSAASVKTTPALHSSERVRTDAAGAASGQKMFPLFRRKDGLMKLYIVRHGESTYNAAMAAKGSSWADPQIFDAELTERGRQQARALRQQLAALDLPPDTLWLTSPLQRAMQTLLLACPFSHLLGKGPGGSSGGGGQAGDAENSSGAPNAGAEGGGWAPNLMVLQCIAEKVVTCGDIGHPASELRKRFPQLAPQLAALPELWWHCPPGKPNCAVQKLFGSHESKDQVTARIGAFRRWLQDRPERVVVAVGHSSYWRSFEEVCKGSKPAHMRNCEVRLVHF